MPHIIRLRGPWEHEPLLPEGTARFTRRFHRPTGLDAVSRVWLAIDDVDWHASVVLNDRSLGQIVSGQSLAQPNTHRCPARFEITADLQPQNVLSITVSSPSLDDNGLLSPRTGREGQPGGLIGLVRLEIE